MSIMNNVVVKYIVPRFQPYSVYYQPWKWYSSSKNNKDKKHFELIDTKRGFREVRGNLRCNVNYELLTLTSGFPFYLPGNIGPAWYDMYSTVVKDEMVVQKYNKNDTDYVTSIKCQVQPCPGVLRPTISELFPNRNFRYAHLSVVTLTMHPNTAKMGDLDNESETEKMAQSFVLAAYFICRKINDSGYWADFINPFSGIPYIYPPPRRTTLYTNHEKFRCMDFQIYSVKNCRVIVNDRHNDPEKQFVGSLFTSVPYKNARLNLLNPMSGEDEEH